MNIRKLKQLSYRIAIRVLRMYWRIFKPTTHGVRVLVTHPTKQTEAVVIRHSYGNTSLWNIPGGGYKPKKESPEEAAKREVFEELNLEISNLQNLGEYRTGGEGKKDIVIIFSGVAVNPKQITISAEISEVAWVEIKDIPKKGDTISKVAKCAVEKIIH